MQHTERTQYAHNMQHTEQNIEDTHREQHTEQNTLAENTCTTSTQNSAHNYRTYSFDFIV